MLLLYKLLLTAVYGYVLFVHYSKWRAKLPRKFSSSNIVFHIPLLLFS